jgi:hypothetical protein
MAESNPIYPGGNRPRSYTAGGTIAGGQVVELSAADTVIVTSGVSIKVVGVAADDAVVGEQVTVWPLAGVTHEVTATAAVAVGAVLTSSTTGGVVGAAAQTGTELIGIAATAAGAGGVKIQMVGR